MAGLNLNIFTGQLTINSVVMHGPAWNVLDLKELWMPPPIRGSDRLLPGAPGVRARRRRVTVAKHSLPMVITGLASYTGAGVDDLDAAIIQLQDNLDYLRTNVLDPVPTGDGTRSATITMPSGGTRTADIHVEGLTVVQAVVHTLTATLDISIPAGAFA